MDTEILSELLKNMPSEEEFIAIDAEKTRQDFEALTNKNPTVHYAWRVYMNCKMSEEHLYQKIVIALSEQNEELKTMCNKLLMTSTKPFKVT